MLEPCANSAFNYLKFLLIFHLDHDSLHCLSETSLVLLCTVKHLFFQDGGGGNSAIVYIFLPLYYPQCVQCFPDLQYRLLGTAQYHCT